MVRQKLAVFSTWALLFTPSMGNAAELTVSVRDSNGQPCLWLDAQPTWAYNAQPRAKSSQLQIATQNVNGLYQLGQIAVWWGCDTDPVSLRMAKRTCRNML